jgi:DNA-binding SARP family transcriptional activator
VPLTSTYTLQLMGEFVLRSPDGRLMEGLSRKSRALIAMLAIAEDGRRGRAWLRDKLWGRRGRAQGQSSLRQEIHNLRRTLAPSGVDLIQSTSSHVAINLDMIDVDVRSEHAVVNTPAVLLDGFELPYEDGFREWLEQARRKFSRKKRAHHFKPLLGNKQNVIVGSKTIHLSSLRLRNQETPEISLRFAWSHAAVRP